MVLTRSTAKSGRSRRHIETANEEIQITENQPELPPPCVDEKPPSPSTSALVKLEETNPQHREKTRSKCTSKSSQRAHKIALAKEELARREVELAAARLATLEAEESEDEGTVCSGQSQASVRVNDWLNKSQPHLVAKQQKHEQKLHAPLHQSEPATPKQRVTSVLPKPPPIQCTPIKDQHVSPQQNDKIDISGLASAIVQAARTGQQHHRHFTELPLFNGAYQDWLAFETAYYTSADSFSSDENVARLRRVLRGRAREAVESLLITNCEPSEIMRTLKSRFGRPDSIALADLERLRSLPKPTDTAKDICIFATQVNNIVATLRALNRTHYLYNPEVTRTTIEKLTPALKYRWYDFAASQPEEMPDLLKLSTFLSLESELCSRYAQPEVIQPETSTHTRRTHRTYVTSATCTTSSAATAPRDIKRTETQKTEKKCPVCDTMGHYAATCTKFSEADSDGRWDIAKQHRLCFRCLRYRNKTHSCRTGRCNVDGCQQWHHKLLHFLRKESEKETENQDTENVASMWMPKKTHAYLKIIPVRVCGPAGVEDAQALLDDGSTVTLIDYTLAEKIGAEGPIDPLHIAAIADTKLAATTSRRVAIEVIGLNSQRHKINARTVTNLQLGAQQVTEKDLEGCLHLEDIKEHLKYDRQKPTLLVGQDNWHLLLAMEVRQGQRHQPIASLTPLGWVLHGAHTRQIGRRLHNVNHLTVEDQMDEQLKQYFALDSIIINPKKPKTDPEQKALDILDKCTKQTENGIYQTALLWKNEDMKLPNNYDSAMRRLIATEKRIDSDPQLRAKYNEQMDALLEKGYAERAPTHIEADRTWYLPHFPVLNPSKPGKVRVVHDAASKYKGASLNDHLLTGPDLLQSLPGVLMRFRQHPIAVTADIAEMFMRISIRPEDRNALRYLWRGDRRHGAPNEYRMTALIFGATSSPATAIYVKNRNALRFEQSKPTATTAIIRNHYVDDYLDSFPTEDEAIETAKEVRDIHHSGNFNLRGWASNSVRVMKALDSTKKTEPLISISLDDDSKMERVLGLIWKPHTDELTFNLDLARIPLSMLNATAPTKRQALKIMMSIYDPLGFASPVTIQAKRILQEVWRQGTTWDQPLKPDLSSQWAAWIENLKQLRYITIPRCYLRYSNAASLQLHTFVDASETAYAAALYWRVETTDGNAYTSLIMAKARVAPLKVTSIPRLELQAAVMGSRMATAVLEEHPQKPESKTFWTDSRTVLAWLKTGSRAYKPYVAHRIAAIEDNSTIDEWRWTPTKLNVADDATRHVPNDFNSSHRWFTGPEFLRESPSEWPSVQPTKYEQTGEEKTCHVTEIEISACHSIPDVTRFSKWERLLRSAARVLQFIALCRHRCQQRVHYKRTAKNNEKDPEWKRRRSPIITQQKKRENTDTEKFVPIDAELLHTAEKLLIQASQEQTFQEDINNLKIEKSVPNTSRLRALSVELTNNIIRMKTRIGLAAGVTPEQKSPAILDGNHATARLWIEYTHRKLLHAGVETTVNECKQHYWVLRLRPATRAVVRRCLLCRMRYNAPSAPPTGDHPLCRLAHHRRPFSYVGVDYYGPMTVTVGRSRQKRYGVLFTCLTTRAVHLELASSLTTDSAILALRRLIARRGCPTEIWSDNGTNLRGADRTLRQAMDRSTEEEASKHKINWRFIVPGAPFMGGAWERLVRSVKTALSVALNERYPSEETLATLLAEIEYTVNSRPLTHVSVSPEDPEALTPNHFLLGGSARVPAPGHFTDADLVNRHHWRSSQRLADLFWARWVREYLPELQHRREPRGRGPPLKVGDVVFIIDGTLPRNTWPRGRVTATYPGSDGVVRAADVKTRAGTLRRATKKLLVIPTEPAALLTTGDCNAAKADARRE